MQFEGSVDASNYASLQCSALASGSTATSSTSTGVWVCGVGGLKSVRARVSAYTSGTVGINLQAAAAGGGSGGGGGAAGSVTINDPNTTSQKAAVNASGQLSITCANCSGSGASAVDESAFTQGTNSIAPSGGLYTTSYTALTSGQAGIAQITSDGAFYTNVSKILGTAIDVNSGNKSNGTQRVVLATDQPALTNALKVDPSAVTSPISAASLPLPSGAATAAKQPALGTAGTASSDVITVQGISSMTKLLVTPDLPSGASTAAKQPALGTAGTASSDVLTVQGIASMTKLLVTPDLPTGASTSTKQSDGSQKTQIVDGSGNVIASTSNNLNVQCANCSGSGASAADEATFTAGSSSFAPAGGFFQTTATNNALTTGQQGMAKMTAQRALFSNLRNASGTEVGTSSAPLQVTVANTGANSTAIKVDGSAVTQPVSGTFWQATQPVSGTVTANNSTASNLKAQVAQLASVSTSVTLQSGVTANGNGTTLATDGMATAILTVNCATCSGGTTVNFEGSEDASNFASISATQLGTNTVGTSTTTAGVTVWALPVAGFQTIRARVSAYSAGTVTVTGHPVPVGQAQNVVTLGTGSNTIGALSANQSVNLAQVAGATTATGHGTASGSIRVELPTDGTGVVNAAESGTWTVQPGNTANTTAWLVKHQAGTPVLENALSTTVQTVTGSAGILDAYFCWNPNASVEYVQIFDISGTVTLGTSTPKWSIGIPPTSGGNLSQMAINFANAIKVAATTTATGSSAPGTALDCNFSFR